MLLEGCWTYMLDEDNLAEDAVLTFLFKLHQPVDQGRAVSAGKNRESRWGDGLEVCRHWSGDQGQQCMMAGGWQGCGRAAGIAANVVLENEKLKTWVSDKE